MKRFSVLVLILFIAFLFMGCYTMVHQVGNGPAGSDKQTARQWYILWGLVPLNHVDSHAMAAGAENYQIQTQLTTTDFIINIFTGYVTVYSQTVTVTK